jgi:6-phosphofructokinase 1
MTQKNIGILYGGGHVSSFNAGTLGILDKADALGYNVVGFFDGYKGLVKGSYAAVDLSSPVEAVNAGTFLGSSRDKLVQNDGRDDFQNAKQNLRRLKIDGLIVLGGNDHLTEAYRLHQSGVNVVGWPKTMDNDLSETEFTLGYPTAVEVASSRIWNAHYGAQTNKKIYFIPLFGRNTDWVAAGACMWGGGEFFVPSEKEYEFGAIVEKAGSAFENNGLRYGRPFAVIPVAEGAKIKGLESHVSRDDIDTHGNLKIEPMKLALVLKEAWKMSKQVPKQLKNSVVIDSITYEMRDAPPVEKDSDLAREAGVKCVELIDEGRFGHAAVFKKDAGRYVTDSAPLEMVSRQRFMSTEGFVDYEAMRPKGNFGEYYHLLFGPPPEKEDVVPFQGFYSNELKA